MKTRHHLVTVVGILALCSMLGQRAVAGTLQIIRTLDLPSPAGHGHDVAWDGEHLWTMAVMFPPPDFGTTSATLRELDPLDGSLLNSFGVELFSPEGLAWDGSDLWIANNTSVFGSGDYGTPPDALPDSIDRFSKDGTHLGSFSPPYDPDAITKGIAWDGTHLWLSDRKHREIMQVNPADGAVVRSFPSPGTGPDSLTWDGSSLWALDSGDNLIYQLDTFGNVLQSWSTPGIVPVGITFDGEYFWLLDADAEKLHQVAIPEPCTLALLGVGVVTLLLAVVNRKAARTVNCPENSSAPFSVR